MIGFPFDSQVTYDEYGVPSFDRAISSQPLRSLINKLFSDGVMPNPSTNMQVVANSGMTIKIKPGFAIVKGCLKLEDAERTIEFEAASTSDRIDTVVLRLNDETSVRQLDFAVHKGTPATSPVRPELTRSGSIYEIGLADVFIPKNTSIITTSRITDTRLETARCGIVSSVSQFDTTTLYNQVQADLTDFKTDEQAAWLEWFNNLQYVLDGDVAGHLQNEIDTTNNKIGTTAIPSSLGNTITGAINSLNSTIGTVSSSIELKELVSGENNNFIISLHKTANIYYFYLYFKRGVTVTAWTQSIYTLPVKPIHDTVLINSLSPTGGYIVIKHDTGEVISNVASIPQNASFMGCFV